MNTGVVSHTLQLGTPLEQARGVVILLHGRGSSGEDIAGLGDVLAADGLAFLAPTAPGGAWYPQRFLVALAQNEPWLSRALRQVDELVRAAHAAGVPYEHIGLVGFSQGACLALEYAARNPRQYGLVGGLSGALIGPLDTPRSPADLNHTPVLLGCAEDDAHIPLPFVEHSAATLTAFGAKVTKRIFPGSGHTVYPEEVQWLRRELAAWSCQS